MGVNRFGHGLTAWLSGAAAGWRGACPASDVTLGGVRLSHLLGRSVGVASKGISHLVFLAGISIPW